MYNLLIKEEFAKKHSLTNEYSINTNERKDYAVVVLTDITNDKLKGSGLFISQHPHYYAITHGIGSTFFNSVLDFNSSSDTLAESLAKFENIIDKELIVLSTHILSSKKAEEIMKLCKHCIIFKDMDIFTLFNECEYEYNVEDLELSKICQNLTSRKFSFDITSKDYLNQNEYKKFRDLEMLINIAVNTFLCRLFHNTTENAVAHYISTILLKSYLDGEYVTTKINFNKIAVNIIKILDKTLKNRKDYIYNILTEESETNDNIKRFCNVNNIETFLQDIDLLTITYYGVEEIYNMGNITELTPLYKLINIIDKYNNKILQCGNVINKFKDIV